MYTEADTKSKHIEPNLKKSGWDESNIAREYKITADSMVVVGEEYHTKNTAKFADYVLKI
ncbi:type I restriction enzyme, R subunit, partial [Candidatus Vampirococcus lugosii]|nr:type I restriction enzyme, R subunit [Candidatus Vampirococcus lugosii]